VSAINVQPSRDGEHRADRAHPVTAADLLGGAMACFCETASAPGSGGGVLVLRVTGEIDMLTLPVVRDALSAAVARHPADLVVDLAGVNFCCVHGFALLAAAARTARIWGTGYALSGMNPHLDRVATLLDPEKDCVQYRSVAAAVTAIRVRHTYRPQRATSGEATRYRG
jgi:anti-anti-sigma factor